MSLELEQRHLASAGRGPGAWDHRGDLGPRLVELADEIVGAGKLLGAAQAISLVAPGAAPRLAEPAALFDRLVQGEQDSGWATGLEVVVRPGQPFGGRALRPGDLIIRRAVGESPLTHIAMVVSGELVTESQLALAGLIAERSPFGTRPGLYVQVIDGGAFPHRRSDRFARRLGDAAGRLCRDCLVLRLRGSSGEAIDSAWSWRSDGVGGDVELEESELTESWETADSAENVLLHPVTPGNIRHGPLAATRGGLVTDASLRPRVSVIVGPGATPRGIAQRLHGFFPAGSMGGQSTPAPLELAQALVVYCQYYWPVPAMRNWRDGLRVPVFIEIDPATGDWIVNPATIRLWAGSFDPAWTELLDRRPARLDPPDVDQLPRLARDFLGQHATAVERGVALQAQIVSNPFEAVFLSFEVLRQLPPDAGFEVAIHAMGQSVNHQLQLLARVTAGQAILLQLERTLSRVPTNATAERRASAERAVRMLDAALRPGGRLAVPRELPETRQQLATRPGGIGRWQEIRATDPAGGLHRMALGRDVLTGESGSFSSAGKTYRGPAYGGRIPPGPFMQSQGALLNPDNSPLQAARMAVVQAIAVNEGFLDAVRMRDRGIISVGLHQWSAHVDIELPSLLWRFKQMAEDEFALFFGTHRLDVRENGQDSHGNLQFMLRRIEDAGTFADLTTWHMRRDFFGGRTAGNLTVFETTWAARMRAAPVNSLKFRAAEILEATARFDRILREVPTINVGGRAVRLNDLITSQLGVAYILDAHINQPVNVPADLQAAANAAGAHADADALERAIVGHYATVRRTYDTPQRTANINRQNLDAQHGSFAGW